MKRFNLETLGVAVGLTVVMITACSSPGEGPTIEISQRLLERVLGNSHSSSTQPARVKD